MASKSREGNQAMAAYMKEHKIERESGRCSLCYTIVSLNMMYSHISFHKPFSKKKHGRRNV